ncbi:MAG TPA: FAD-binding protein [Steroidobacteraceae bacterium]
MYTIDTDVLIVGAGIAGLTTALNACRRRVCILSQEEFGAAGTASDLAQGGIAAAVGPDDSAGLHLRDTFVAGCAENSVPVARFVCREAPEAIGYLQTLGVPFAQAPAGWSLHREGGHSVPRVLHVDGDRTGAAIMSTLRRHIAQAAHIDILSATRAVSLLVHDSAAGVLAVSGDNEPVAIHARDVVIATGGIGGLYSRSTNPIGACGDGLAMAIDAGARSASLELVQFHPTALKVDGRPLPLLTEALRGAGARLVDERGVSVMQEVHPMGDLAPRDVVARTIYTLERSGRPVWLDATCIDLDLRKAFPATYELCHSHGFDLTREPVPVTPAVHYHMGGIAVDLSGRASLPGLRAVGEVACTGLHGANRLASNSLLEAVVFGRRLGRMLTRERGHPSKVPVAGETLSRELSDEGVERSLREIMWRSMGVVRSARGLSEGLTCLARLRDQLSPHAHVTRSRLLVAEHMMRAAARQRANRGAHFRSDAAPEEPAHRPEAIDAQVGA